MDIDSVCLQAYRPLAWAAMHEGDGWATRIEDAIQHGCIPVIFQDGVQVGCMHACGQNDRRIP